MELRLKAACNGQTNCNIFPNVLVRPVWSVPPLGSHLSSYTIQIPGAILTSYHSLHSNSCFRKAFFAALILGALLSPAGLAQDSGRKVLKKIPVTYPAILKSKGIGGVVRLKVFVKPDGSVRDVEVLGGNPILAESAQKSVLQWKFYPASSETMLELSVVFDPHNDAGD